MAANEGLEAVEVPVHLESLPRAGAVHDAGAAAAWKPPPAGAGQAHQTALGGAWLAKPGTSGSSSRGDQARYKRMALVLQVLQTTALVLLMRTSMTTQSTPYIKSTAVVMAEAIKVVLSLGLVCHDLREPSLANLGRELHRELIVNWQGFSLLLVPAGLYVVQNNLIYVALQNLHATTYQVTYQMKIIVTAMFAVSRGPAAHQHKHTHTHTVRTQGRSSTACLHCVGEHHITR